MKQVNAKRIYYMALVAPAIHLCDGRLNKTPDQVPTHFNFKGEPDDYSGKAFALLLMPFLNIVIYFVLFIPRIDPTQKNYESFGSSYQEYTHADTCISAGYILSSHKQLPVVSRCS